MSQVAPDDRREDLNAAIAQHEGPAEAAPNKPDTLPPPEFTEQTSGDEGGFHVEQQAETSEKIEAVDNKAEKVVNAPETVVKLDTPKPSKKPPSAPVGWDAEAKAAFSTLPENVQRAVQKREVEINRGLQEASEARQFNQQVAKTLEPYRAIIQAHGTDNPLQAIDGLMKTATQLTIGSPAQKAAMISKLIQDYGVDIETLDKTLAGTQPQNTEEERINRIIAERMAPVNNLMQQVEYAQHQQQQQVYGHAVQSVEEFGQDPQHVHFDNVRYVMADFLDMAAQQGQNLSLDEAYRRACYATPGIAEQMAAQQSQQYAQQTQQHTQAKRNAASSISGQRSAAAGPAGLENLSLREMISAQIPQAGR